eukprot:362866-Chlamydomonas_euryale.AAC.30
MVPINDAVVGLAPADRAAAADATRRAAPAGVRAAAAVDRLPLAPALLLLVPRAGQQCVGRLITCAACTGSHSGAGTAAAVGSPSIEKVSSRSERHSLLSLLPSPLPPLRPRRPASASRLGQLYWCHPRFSAPAPWMPSSAPGDVTGGRPPQPHGVGTLPRPLPRACWAQRCECGRLCKPQLSGQNWKPSCADWAGVTGVL